MILAQDLQQSMKDTSLTSEFIKKEVFYGQLQHNFRKLKEI